MTTFIFYSDFVFPQQEATFVDFDSHTHRRPGYRVESKTETWEVDDNSVEARVRVEYEGCHANRYVVRVHTEGELPEEVGEAISLLEESTEEVLQ
jgi:hypothetical protein